jgi:hypothetical protein
MTEQELPHDHLNNNSDHLKYHAVSHTQGIRVQTHARLIMYDHFIKGEFEDKGPVYQRLHQEIQIDSYHEFLLSLKPDDLPEILEAFADRTTGELSINGMQVSDRTGQDYLKVLRYFASPQ